MSKIGTTELLVILAIALLIFGPTVLPKLGKAMGKTIAGFKKGVSETDFDDDAEEAPESKKNNAKKSKVKAAEDKPVKKKKSKPVEESEDEDEDDTDADAEDDADSEDDE